MDPIEKHQKVLKDVEDYFDDRVETFGASYKGLDFNSVEAQEIRFDQLLKVIDSGTHFSLNDYGCGFGSLAHYMVKQGYEFDYQGFDISKEMINNGISLIPENKTWEFTSQLEYLKKADYTIASGIFNLRFESKDDDWMDYILDTLKYIYDLSNKGFSFNMLTKYSDKEYMRPDLYYSDPLFFFDHCKRNFSRNVALLHDYELYDFTILVRL